MSTYPMSSRSVPITVADQLGRWRLARAAAHIDRAEQLLAQARRELTAATVLVNSAGLPKDACGMPGPVFLCDEPWRSRRSAARAVPAGAGPVRPVMGAA